MNKSFEQLASLKADKYKDVMLKFADIIYEQYGIEITIKMGCLLKRCRTFKTLIYFGSLDKNPIVVPSLNLTWRKIFNAIFWIKMKNGKRRTHIFRDSHNKLRSFVMPKSIDEALVMLDLRYIEEY